MSLLIINADDFGYSTGINYGIIDSYQKGILTSTTMMANMPGFEEGVKLAKENPNLGIGVHLNLTCGSALSEDVFSLTNNNGEFHDISFYQNKFNIDSKELYQEWKMQTEKIINSGISPTHFDSHHHVNRLPIIKEVFIKLVEEYNLPVRNNFDVPNHIKTTKRFNTSFESIILMKEIWKPLEVKNLIQDCNEFKVVEIMCHPGYVDNFLLNHSSLRENRAVMVAELQKESYKEILKEECIQLGTYADL